MSRSRNIAEGVSPAVDAALRELFASGSNEQYVVADCLNTMAKNGDGCESDEQMLACIEELRSAIDQVHEAISPQIAAPEPVVVKIVDDPYERVIVEAEKAAGELDGFYDEYADPPEGPAARPSTQALRSAIQTLTRHLASVSNRGGRLELHNFPDRKLSLTEQVYLNGALKYNHKDGELEFSEETVVSVSTDGGAYVLGWTWVEDDDVDPPQHFEAHIYLVTADRVSNWLCRAACLAVDEDHARRILLAEHWEPRLDAAGCSARVEFDNFTPLETYEFTLQGDEHNGLSAIGIDAVSREEALEILHIVRPWADVVEEKEDAGELDIQLAPGQRELRLQLATGCQLCSGWIDEHDPDSLGAGDYLKVLDKDDKQVFYVDSADLFADPVKGRQKLNEMLQACLGLGVADKFDLPGEANPTPTV